MSDPYRGFLFTVSLGANNSAVAGFSEVTVPDVTIDTVDYREGNQEPYRKVLSGLYSFGRVTLQRGLTNDLTLYNWHRDVMNYGSSASTVRKQVIISLNDGNKNNKVVSWTLSNAWPVRLQTGALNAGSSEVVIETLELAIESMTRR
jgi:phage tail-like protein